MFLYSLFKKVKNKKVRKHTYMEKLPKLINWNALSGLLNNANKKASTESPLLISKEKPVVDAFGKKHEPKTGFSGPHLNTKGLASYMKDGREWCPYHNAFLDDKKAFTENVMIKVAEKFTDIDNISSDPTMLSRFCHQHGYEGEPIACLRVAFHSTSRVLRKFAMLAALEAEDRILKKQAQFDASSGRIFSPEDPYPIIQRKLTNFITQSAAEAEEKNLADIFDNMIRKIKQTDDSTLLSIVNEIIEPESSAPKDQYESEREEEGRKSRDAMNAEMFFVPLDEEKLKSIIPSLAKTIADKWTNIRSVLKSSPQIAGKDFPEEFSSSSYGSEVGSMEGFSKLKEDKSAACEMELSKEAKKAKKSKKSVPTNPALWSRCLSWAKARYDVCPSAYCNGAAAKRYKKLGGKWRKGKK